MFTAHTVKRVTKRVPATNESMLALDRRRYFRCSEIDPTYLSVETDQPRVTGIKKTGAIEAEVISRLVEYADMKDAAAQLLQVENEMRQNVCEVSRLEQLRIQQAAEILRELPAVKSR